MPRPEQAAAGNEPSSTPAADPNRSSHLFDRETSIRRALILAMGTSSTERPVERGFRQAIQKLLDIYRHDPDAGHPRGGRVDAAAMAESKRNSRRPMPSWRRSKNGTTAAGGSTPGADVGPHRWARRVSMGSPASDPDYPTPKSSTDGPFPGVCHRRQGSFDRPVQWFWKQNPAISRQSHRQVRPDRPARGRRDLVHAAAYCNWLSEQEGRPKDQWCYPPNEAGALRGGDDDPGRRAGAHGLPPAHRGRMGVRMPGRYA